MKLLTKEEAEDEVKRLEKVYGVKYSKEVKERIIKQFMGKMAWFN